MSPSRFWITLVALSNCQLMLAAPTAPPSSPPTRRCSPCPPYMYLGLLVLGSSLFGGYQYLCSHRHLQAINQGRKRWTDYLKSNEASEREADVLLREKLKQVEKKRKIFYYSFLSFLGILIILMLIVAFCWEDKKTEKDAVSAGKMKEKEVVSSAVAAKSNVSRQATINRVTPVSTTTPTGIA